MFLLYFSLYLCYNARCHMNILKEARSRKSKPEARPVYKNNNFEILTGRGSTRLAAAVGAILEQEVDQPITLFDNKEEKPAITHNVGQKDVFIIQSTSPPDADHYWMELFLMIDAARRASAGEITAVIPYFGYSRQDRKDEPRVSISASALARQLEANGIARIMTVDQHSEQAQGFVLIPWDNLFANVSLAPAIKQNNQIKNLVMVGPDIAGLKRASRFAKKSRHIRSCRRLQRKGRKTK